MTIDEKKQYLTDHLQCWTSVKKALAENIPIPPTLGEGFTFSMNGEDYITRHWKDNKGNSIIKVSITTWSGYSPDASHYYGRLRATINNTKLNNPDSWVSGYLGGIKIPDINQSWELDIVREISAEEIAAYPCRNEYNYPGGKVCHFNSKEELLEVLEKIKECFGPGWVFEENPY